MNPKDHLEFRPLDAVDPERLSAAFARIGWNKPPSQYQRYLEEQSSGTRWVCVAVDDDKFMGYVTVLRGAEYPSFREKKIPEIQDLNVLPEYRGRGIGSRLLDRAESWIGALSKIAGLGVGLHPGYNQAIRIYVKRGYIPDGEGVTYAGRRVAEGELVRFDDELVLWMTKALA